MLELVSHPQLRGMLLSAEAAILFTADMKTLLWTNAPGAELLGIRSWREGCEGALQEHNPFVRQLAGAAAQVRPGKPVVRGFRFARGRRVDFIQCQLAVFPLPDASDAILLTCTDEMLLRTVREHEHAALVLHSLAGLADNAAILDEFGLIIAATDAFLAIDVDEETLPHLVNDAARAQDGESTRVITALDGAVFTTRTARMTAEPPRFLAICETLTDQADTPKPTELETASDRSVDPSNSSDSRNASIAATPLTVGEPQEPAAMAVRQEHRVDPAQPTAPAQSQSPENARSSPRSLLDRWYLRQADLEPSSPGGARRVQNDDQDSQAIEPSKPVMEIPTKPDHAEVNRTAVRSGMPDVDTDAGAVLPADSTDSGQRIERRVPAEDEDETTSQAEMDFSRAPFRSRAADPDSVRAKEASDDAGTPFRFTSDGEAVRFAWTIDASGIFRSLSPELAETVGPNAADIVGRSWREVATVFGFDRDREIARLLEKRDTWSGKMVLWPVQGTDLVLPIDLAALPSFNQARQFDGFRGFGIIRKSDAIVDQDEIGKALADGPYRPVIVSENPAEARRPSTGMVVDMASRRARTEGEPSPQDDRLSGREARAFEEIAAKLGSDTSVESLDGPPGSNDILMLQQANDPLTEHSPDHTRGGDNGTRQTSDRQAENNQKTIVAAGQILQQLPVPILVYRNGETLFANHELLDVTGFASREAISEAGGVPALISVSEIGEGENATMSLVRRDGSHVRVSPVLRTVPWDGDKALLLTLRRAGASDLTEKAAIDMVRVSELENILDTATDGIIVTNRDGKIESLNASGEALFGITFDEAKGGAVSSLFAQESRKTIEDYMAELLQPGVAGIMNDGREVIGREAKGGLIPLFITIGKLGEFEKYCIVLRDITSWKKAEEELVSARREAESASELKTEFLARVSHEIRTPLNAIIGFSDVMIEERFGPIDNERYREYLRDINRSGVHVLDLINDLLDISKIEAGKLDLSYEAVDLNQLVSETVALMQPQANVERIIIRTSLSRAVPRVVADVRSVRQVILNLVSNAIKFTAANGQVIVSTVYEGNGEVVLRVRDTGRGMTAAEIEQAMKPFSQVNSLDERRGRGTGLGLPLTKALVEANRAYFDLESRPGEGTIAHVHFPIQRVLAD